MLLIFRMLITLLAFSMGALLCGPSSAQSISDRFKNSIAMIATGRIGSC
jgi:uncharacterized membrane protein